jgi:hypothetical protein
VHYDNVPMVQWKLEAIFMLACGPAGIRGCCVQAGLPLGTEVHHRWRAQRKSRDSGAKLALTVVMVLW